MISYAQNREDVLLQRVFADQASGFYVDVGANHPEISSITKHFYDRGWKGINIEPGEVHVELAAQRPRDITLPIGLSNQPGERLFHYFPDNTAQSTFSASECEDRRGRGLEPRSRMVQVSTLRAICAEHMRQPIDFMSIDVEGHERQVIEGGDWKQWRPRVLVVESTLPNLPTPAHADWEPLVLRAGYLFAYFDGLNRFYVREEEAELRRHFESPVCVFDAFAPAEWVRRVEALEHALRERERECEAIPLGRFARGVANRIQKASDRLPRLRHVVKRLLGIGANPDTTQRRRAG